ncbi:hypothetical protein F4777DRAFT_582649 [Nemania sp. FL0916]|nr:hypothetical protein F4777DRAFT_582649 [Nemania sp. FL0916]
MRFFQALVAASAFMTLGSSAAIGDKKLAARDTPFADLGLPQSFWNTLSSYCPPGISQKRDPNSLEAREQKEPTGYTGVKPGNELGQSNVYKFGGLWTNNLVTCIGVAIIGDVDTSKDMLANDKFLAHFFATAESLDSQWPKLQALIDTAGATNLKAWYSAPDTSQLLPGLNAAYMQQVEDKMVSLLKTLTGQDPTPRHHVMADARAETGQIGVMQINAADRSVTIDGNNVPFGSPEP